MKVSELGERELIRQVVLPILARSQSDHLGDDCAVLPWDDKSSLLITTDIGSRIPFLRMLQVGSFIDLGHLFATMSLSDIAAMAGTPIALVSACSFDLDFDSEHFRGLVTGLALACEEQGAEFVGGDTKEGPELRVVTTAIGKVETSRVLSRRGAQAGDIVCVSGRIGSVLRSYIRASRCDDNNGEMILRPKARVEFARSLASQQLATSCIDMSDGPIAAAQTLGELNQVEVNLNLDALDLADPPFEQISPELWRSFILNVGGDYELMFTARASNKVKLIQIGAVICGTVERAKGSAGAKLTGEPIGNPTRPWEHFCSTVEIKNLLKAIVEI
jgi:thiamine-monophosphate kinase